MVASSLSSEPVKDVPSVDGRQRLKGSDTSSESSADRLSVKSDGKLGLKRRVGLLSGVAMIVGTMIGSGIFVSVGSTLERTQSAGLALVIWGVCGVYSLLGAVSYCEIGTLIPKSGGEYAYFLEAFGPLHAFLGPLPAFLFAWVVVFLLKPSSLAILSLSFAKYLTLPILQAAGVCYDDDFEYLVSRLTAALCIGVLSFVNCWSVTLATRVQNVFTVAKLAALAIIIGGGVYYLALGETQNLEDGFAGSTTNFGDIAQAFYGGIWAYDGWNNLNFITEELKDPFRNLPLAIAIGIPLTTLCYVLVNVAYLAVLTPQQIIETDAVGSAWAQQVLGPAAFLIPLGVCMSVFGTANGSVFTAGRLSHVAGREGHMLDMLSYVHIEKRTPVMPILLNGLLGLIMIIPGDIGSLIDFFGFTSSIFYCLTMVALISMRFTRKDAVRPIKVPIVIPIIVMVISALLVVTPIASNPQLGYIYALCFIFAGLFFYVPFVYYKKVLPGLGGLTYGFQLLLKVAPTEH